MTTLRVVIDGILDPTSRGVARYTEELARALILVAPRGTEVEGIVSASTEPEYADLHDRLPGLTRLYKTALSRRELVRAWQHGFTTSPGGGMIHAPSLLAPLRRHDRLNAAGEQVVVTIHDLIPWTAPDTLDGRPASWYRSMAKRAQKYADGVVVPTHALADELAEHVDFGDRVRVIPPAISPNVREPADADERAARLGLPQRYLLTLASLNPRKGLAELLEAIRGLDIALLVVGEPGWRDASVPESDSIVSLGVLDDSDYLTVLARALAFVEPALISGPGAPILEAMHLGTPVIAADLPQSVELAADGALFVPRSPEGYVDALRAAIESLLSDDRARERLTILGQDRARSFTWAGAADKVWQLHADL